MTNQFKIEDRPISGDIQARDKAPVNQISAQEFLDAIDKVLAVPGVTGLVWDQYTPYFNDGEPCEFSVHDVRVLLGNETADDAADGEGESLFDDDSYVEYSKGYSTADLYTAKEGGNKWEAWSGSYWSKNRALDKSKVSFIASDGTDLEPIFDALSAFPSTDSWEAVAQASFGDHAEVTATKEGFSVEFYDHD